MICLDSMSEKRIGKAAKMERRGCIFIQHEYLRKSTKSERGLAAYDGGGGGEERKCAAEFCHRGGRGVNFEHLMMCDFVSSVGVPNLRKGLSSPVWVTLRRWFTFPVNLCWLWSPSPVRLRRLWGPSQVRLTRRATFPFNDGSCFGFSCNAPNSTSDDPINGNGSREDHSERRGKEERYTR